MLTVRFSGAREEAPLKDRGPSAKDGDDRDGRG